MRKMLVVGWLALVCSWWSLAVQAQGGAQAGAPVLAANTIPSPLYGTVPPGTPLVPPQVSLVTFAPGTIYWERFGHVALLLRNPQTGVAVAYHYGIFDFSESNFMWNFARGLMRYRMSADPWENTVYFYQREKRWALEQQLNLTEAQRVALAEYLDWNLQPGNSRYPYDYFRSNCSTRVRDALDRAMNGALRRQLQTQYGSSSYRQQAVHLMAPETLLAMGMDLGLGPLVDQPLNLWDESFVPMVLRDALRRVRVTAADGSSQPLVLSEQEWVPAAAGDSITAPATPVRAPDWRLPFIFAGIGFALLLAVLARVPSRAAQAVRGVLAGGFWIVTGIGGLVLVLLWTSTLHWGAWRNQNLLLLNPLALALIPSLFGVRWSRQLVVLVAAAAWLTLLFKLITLLPASVGGGFWQDNWAWMLLLLPIHSVLAFDAWKQPGAKASPARLAKAGMDAERVTPVL